MTKSVRLDRLLANLGYGSRRQVQDMVDAGWVAFDGSLVARADAKVPLVDDLPTRLKVRGALHDNGRGT